ncbi:MAG: hypothetical protein GY859_32920 [Desulfobacterales bacterium]|nr:hypothetical protein [Desulfobacterales bacterium]
MTTVSAKSKRLVGLFLLGCVLFNHPVLNLFDSAALFLGVPLLYLYVFTAWAGLIILIILATRSRPRSPYRDFPEQDKPC